MMSNHSTIYWWKLLREFLSILCYMTCKGSHQFNKHANLKILYCVKCGYIKNLSDRVVNPTISVADEIVEGDYDVNWSH